MTGRVLITGGAGFIGSHTADLLSSKGYKIRILDSLEPPIHVGRWPNYVMNKGYELIKRDVRDKKTLLKALKGIDYIIHLAAYQDQLPDFSKFFAVNTLSTALIYELIVENKFPIKKIVYASSQFIYGDGFYLSNDGEKFFPELRSLEQLKKKTWDILDKYGRKAKFIPFKESQAPHPTNSYGLSKRASESLALRLGKTYNIPTSVVRYSIVQGARQSPRNIYSGALRIFVTQALAEKSITVYEDGNQLRDFVNVEDVTRANLLMLEDERTDFGVFNVGGGKGYRIIDFAKMVKNITNTNSQIVINGEFRKTDTRNAISNIERLIQLDWIPKYSPEKAIKDYIDWIKKEKFDVEKIVKNSSADLKKRGVVDK